MPEAENNQAGAASGAGEQSGQGQTGSAQPAGKETPGQQSAQANGSAQPPGEYTKFTYPEGATENEGLLKEFVPVAKELKLTQEQAQKLVTLQSQYALKEHQAQEKAWTDLVAGWQKTAREDQEYGGAKFDENLKLASLPIKKFGSDKLVEALEVTGAGNHPEMIRFMVRVAKAMQEGTMVVDGKGGGEAPKDTARLIYTTMDK